MLINPNISEIKKEYTDFLLGILIPLLYEGIDSIYKNSIEQHKRIVEKNKNSTKSSPGILKIFQTQLKEIPSLNNHKIQTESNRIKESSKCSSWFDNLIKAVIKSNIMLLTMEDQAISDYHNTIKTEDFIHKCYISCAKIFYSNPYLFWHEYDNHKIKKNQQIIFKNIKKAIKEAIRSMLPVKEILDEYLSNDYVDQYDRNYEMVYRSVEKILNSGQLGNVEKDKNVDDDIKVCYVSKEDIGRIKDMDNIDNVDNIDNLDNLDIATKKSSEKKSDKTSEIKKNKPVTIDEDKKLQSFINNSNSKIILDFNNFDKKGKNKNSKNNNKGDVDNYFAQYF